MFSVTGLKVGLVSAVCVWGGERGGSVSIYRAEHGGVSYLLMQRSAL